MRRFNLKEARAGAKTCTKSGKSVRIIAFDRDSIRFPIVALIDNRKLACYTNNGKFYIDRDSDNDLMMV